MTSLPGAVLPPARDRLLDPPPRQPAAAHLRGPDRPGPLRRPGAGPGHDLHRDRQRRLAQQPITSFEYKNVGVNIDITPRVHHDGEVTLQLKLDISAVGAPGYQGLPTFNSRTVNSTIRLRDGETNILAGLILDTERRGLTGLPGPREHPVPRPAVRPNKDEAQQTDIVMTLTPHVIRQTDITEEDLRSFLVGGEASPFLFEVPPPRPAAPASRGPAEPPRIEPIRPPSAHPEPEPPAEPVGRSSCRAAPPPNAATPIVRDLPSQPSHDRSASSGGPGRPLLEESA